MVENNNSSIYLIMTADVHQDDRLFSDLYNESDPVFISQADGVESFQLSSQTMNS